MRPPELPGGKAVERLLCSPLGSASMRPPELPGGKTAGAPSSFRMTVMGFNEAAGITRRKGEQIGEAVPPAYALQ